MSTLHRRLLKLEAVDGRHVFRELYDNELARLQRFWAKSRRPKRVREQPAVDHEGETCAQIGKCNCSISFPMS